MSIDVNKMPKLGFGLMRLPEIDGQIDIPRVTGMIDSYMKAGFNYFDTAYVYHGGNSEKAVREILVKNYPRESYTVATKLPGWAIKESDDREKLFNEQLERTGLEYFDYYLLHAIDNGYNCEAYEKFDCFNFCMEKKKEGKIRHFGFSFHGTPELLERLVDEHPEVEFVQIQLNYADWDNPDVSSGKLYEILKSRNIPMIIMEPVKGGTLANVSKEQEEIFKSARPDKSVASWAMRFCGSFEGIGTILSGMSNEEQVADNLDTFVDFEPLTDEDKKVIDKVVTDMMSVELIGCTSCRYCVDGCPAKILIPDIFGAVNKKRQFKGDNGPNHHYKNLTSNSGKASDCIGCGQCEGVCPQHLPIVELLKEAVEKFED